MDVGQWEEYRPATSRPDSRQSLAIVGKGPSIRLTPAVVASMGNPTHTILLIDRVGRRIGLRPSGSIVRHAFPLKQYGHGKVVTVSAGGFFNWAGVDHEERREYDVDTSNAPEVSFALDNSTNAVGEFEEFVYKFVSITHLSPNVSISRSGNMTLNRPSMELIEMPNRVILLHNRDRNLIGIRAAAGERYASAVRQSANQSTWTISVEGFLKRYGIPHNPGRSYEPRLENNMLVLDLAHPKPARRRKSGPAQSNAT